MAPPVIINRESRIVNSKLQRVDIMKLLRLVVLLVVSTTVTGLAAQDKKAASASGFDEAEIAKVAALLPEKPTCFGRPIADRDAWAILAATSGGKAAITSAENLLKTPMPEMTDEIYLIYSRTGSRSEGDRVDGQRRGRIGTLTMAELLENKGRFIPELEKTIRSLCEEKTWVGVAHDGNLANFSKKQVTIDLYSSALAWHLATADNLLGDKLSPATRGLIRKEIQWRICEPYHRMVEGKQSRYWLTAEHNWNSVCLAGVTGAALALLDSRQERAFYILAAEKYSMNSLNGFTPDGYCGEGIGYWNYGFGHYIFLSEEIRLATGGRIDLLSRKEALAPASFGARFEITDGIYPAFADCSPGDRPSGQIMNFLNERLGFGLPVAPSGRVRLGGEGLATGLMYLFPVPATPRNVHRGHAGRSRRAAFLVCAGGYPDLPSAQRLLLQAGHGHHRQRQRRQSQPQRRRLVHRGSEWPGPDPGPGWRNVHGPDVRPAPLRQQRAQLVRPLGAAGRRQDAGRRGKGQGRHAQDGFHRRPGHARVRHPLGVLSPRPAEADADLRLFARAPAA